MLARSARDAEIRAENKRIKRREQRARRKVRKDAALRATLASDPSRVMGQGDYTYARPGPWGKAGRAMGSAAGAAGSVALGAPSLAPLASFLGEKIGGLAHYVGRALGSGDYAVGPMPQSNSLLGETFDGFGTSEGTRICNVEAFAPMNGTTSPFVIHHELEVNPANPALFPWLANIALNYQEYEINGLMFIFVSESPDAIAAVGSLGYVAWCMEYDPFAAAPSTKADVLNRFWSGMVKPSQSYLSFAECAEDTKPTHVSYVWESPTGPTGPKSAYNLGTFYCAGGGQPAGTTELGQMYVVYDITLHKPRLPPDHASFSAPAVGAFTYEAIAAASDVTDNCRPFNPIHTAYGVTDPGLAIVSESAMSFPVDPLNERHYIVYQQGGRADEKSLNSRFGGVNLQYAQAQFLQGAANGSGPAGVPPTALQFPENLLDSLSRVTQLIFVTAPPGTTPLIVSFGDCQLPSVTSGNTWVSTQVWEVRAPIAGLPQPAAKAKTSTSVATPPAGDGGYVYLSNSEKSKLGLT